MQRGKAFQLHLQRVILLLPEPGNITEVQIPQALKHVLNFGSSFFFLMGYFKKDIIQYFPF